MFVQCNSNTIHVCTLSDLQPYIFAGDYFFTQECHSSKNDASECLWTSTLSRVISDVYGQYKIVEVMSGIPTVNSDTEDSSDSVHSSLRLPQQTMDVFGNVNAAVQTEDGVFYAINPNLQSISERLKCLSQVSDTQGAVQIISKDAYKRPRVFFTKPETECSRGDRSVFKDGIKVSACTNDMIKEIFFVGEDAFWEYESVCRKNEEGVSINLFVEDITYYDDTNIVVVVRNGPLSEYYFESGINTVARNLSIPRRSSSIFYFVHKKTLKIQRWVPWVSDSVLLSRQAGLFGMCASDDVMPPVGSFSIAMSRVLTSAANVILNEYILNSYGIIESILAGNLRCKGDYLMHSAYEACENRPFSMNSVYVSWQAVETTWVACMRRTVNYILRRVHVENYGSVIKNSADFVMVDGLDFLNVGFEAISTGVLDVALATFSLFSASFSMFFFIYNEILIVFVHKILSMLFEESEVFSLNYVITTFMNTLYESIETGTFRDIVVAPTERSCVLTSAIFGIDNVLGKFVLHACLGAVNAAFTLVTATSTAFTLGTVSECICSIYKGGSIEASPVTLEKMCRNKMPESIWITHVTQRNLYTVNQGRSYRVRFMCIDMINNYKMVLLNVPDQMIQHIQIASELMVDVPIYILSFLHVPGADSVTCSDYSTNNVVSIIPQPMYAFKRCAFTANCRQKCRREIQWFYSEKESIQTPNKESTDAKILSFLPLWNADALGLQDNFEPIAVQDYGEIQGCDRYIVILGRPLISYEDVGRPWSLYFFCYNTNKESEQYTLNLRSSVELPGTGFFVFSSDTYDKEKFTRVFHVTLFPELYGKLGGTVIAVWDPTEDSYQVLESYVDINTVARTKVIMSKNVILENDGKSCDGLVYNIHKDCLYMTAVTEFRIRFIAVLNSPTETNSYTIMIDFYITVVCSNVQVGSMSTTSLQLTLSRDVNADTQTCNAYEVDSSESVTNYLRGKIILSPPGLIGVMEISRQSPELSTLNILNITKTTQKTTYAIQKTHTFPKKIFESLFSLSKQTVTIMSGDSATPRITSYVGIGLRLSTDENVIFSVLSCVRNYNTLNSDWIKEHVIKSNDQATLADMRTTEDALLKTSYTADKFSVETGKGLSYQIRAKISTECDYLSCRACSTLKLQKLCYAAQKCATARCIGTNINVQNIFCVGGSLLKEIHDVTFGNFMSIWLFVVEMIVSIFSITQLTSRDTQIQVESVSNFVVSMHCELKDVMAVFSAILPSVFFHVISLTSDKKGRGELLDITTGSTSVIQTEISPWQRLETYTQLLACTDMIYSVLLAIYHINYVNTKLFLCFVASLNKYYRISFVSNNVDDDYYSKMCIFDRDNPVNTDADSNEVVLRRLVQSGAIGSYTTTVQFRDKNGNPINNVLMDATTFSVIALKFPKVQMLFYFNAACDWLIGFVSSLQVLGSTFDNEDCKPRPIKLDSVMSCVCDDEGYSIEDKRKKESLKDWAFWCTGILKMVNSEGYDMYVYNDTPLEELEQDLHQAGLNYLECISNKNKGDCTSENKEIRKDKYNHFWGGEKKVSPLAVLNRCRQNYAEKRWDEGIFAYFNEDVRNDVMRVGSIRENTMKNVLSPIELMANQLQFQPVVQCLQSGPKKNSILACMNLFMGISQTIGGIQDYFVYAKHKNPGDVVDACRFLSSDRFQGNKYINACQSHKTHSTCSVESGFSGTQCNVLFSTMSDNYQARRDSLNIFKVHKEFNLHESDASIQQKYKEIQGCGLRFIDDFEKKLTDVSSDLLSKIELELITGEGDIIHQTTDCIIMGAYNKTEIMPSDNDGLLENILYSRHVNGESRDIPLPCAESVITDLENPGLEVLQRTCGTPARIALITYIIKEVIMGQEDGIKNIIIQKIMEKLVQFKTDLSDIGNYGCARKDAQGNTVSGSWTTCCETAGSCKPGESTFEPNLPNISMWISETILSDAITDNFLKGIQELELSSTKVCFFVHIQF